MVLLSSLIQILIQMSAAFCFARDTVIAEIRFELIGSYGKIQTEVCVVNTYGF